jgi:hypothetical protein
MPRKSNQQIRDEQARDIAQLMERSLENPQAERSQSLWFWDRESLALRQQPTGSRLMHRLGNMPIVRDIRPAPDPTTLAFEARREAQSRAGHSGDAGDEMA